MMSLVRLNVRKKVSKILRSIFLVYIGHKICMVLV